MKARPLVFDVGLNNGDDSEYYLQKGFDVVGIDAHVGLCESSAARFRDEIALGRMKILNVGVALEEGTLEFFENPAEDAISTFMPEHWPDRQQWVSRQTQVKKLSSIIREHGDPYFVKIDVEFFDHLVLLDLLTAGIRPNYISAEVHVIDVYCALVSMGYESFKLVVGKSIPETFKGLALSSLQGVDFQHVFSPVSSGPFGEDIPGPWLNKVEVLNCLLTHGLGWIDLHAKRKD